MKDPSEEDEFVQWLSSLPAEEQQRLLSMSALVAAAREFACRAVREGDIRGAWPLLDPLLRQCLVQQWIIDNEWDLSRQGWDRDSVLAAMVQESPAHPLWRHFERVHVRGFSQWDDLTEWGTGTDTRLVSPDVEEVVFLPPHVTEWLPGEEQPVCRFLMRYDHDRERWRVAALQSDELPEPGWPPIWHQMQQTPPGDQDLR